MKKTLTLILLISMIAVPFTSFGAKEKKEKPAKMNKKEMEAEIANLNANADLQKSKIESLEAEKADLQGKIVQLNKDNDQCKQDFAAANHKLEEMLKNPPAPSTAEVQPEPEPVQEQVTEPVKTKGSKHSKASKSGGSSGKVVPGLAFKVQVGAYKNFNISGYFDDPKSMTSEDVDGFKKYLVGYFADLKNAETFEKDMKKMGIKDAWIVPYKDGARISDEEAEQLLGHPLRKK